MTSINIRMDETLKTDFQNVCSELGMDMSTAITIFAKKTAREKRIPFDVSIDPFYSKANIEHLRRGIAALDAGEGKEREITED